MATPECPLKKQSANRQETHRGGGLPFPMCHPKMENSDAEKLKRSKRNEEYDLWLSQDSKPLMLQVRFHEKDFFQLRFSQARWPPVGF